MLCLGARCCCDCRLLAVLAMFFLGNLVLASAVYCCLFVVLVLSTAAAAAVHLLSLLSSWCTLLPLSAAANVVTWIFWFVLCCVDVPIAEAQH
ncbi:hypothetical protein MAM1_0036c02666 [Mucor ambiguus]|uniref:Uncharacterized protein n=1 Tax=Mucor ambiguus TaxID=91626 RepID=A0A0C9LSW6_9FUNG|nr:hypothetical protein MAM1_0036c02666 [Mucor ambiguus]